MFFTSTENIRTIRDVQDVNLDFHTVPEFCTLITACVFQVLCISSLTVNDAVEASVEAPVLGLAHRVLHGASGRSVKHSQLTQVLVGRFDVVVRHAPVHAHVVH